jgi:cytochrome P450
MTTLLGRFSLLIATGDEHKRLRKAIAPAFKAGLVHAMIPSMAETISQLCDDWAGKGVVSGNLKARDFPLMVSGYPLQPWHGHAEMCLCFA